MHRLRNIMRDKLVVIGPTGRPTTGRRTCTVEALAALSEAEFTNVAVINTSPKYSGVLSVAKKQCDIAILLVSLVTSRLTGNSVRAAYLAVNDRWGIIYDLQAIMLLRLFSVKRLTLHHHSRRYCLERSRLLAALLRATKKLTTSHIVQCSMIGCELRSRYSVSQPIYSISNLYAVDFIGLAAAGLEFSASKLSENKSIKVGLVSNLCEDKGVLTFIKVARYYYSLGDCNVEFELGGPIRDKRCQAEIDSAVRDGVLKYLGPIYSQRKFQWLASLDCFLFPSTYVAETEGIVVIEALLSGAVAIVPETLCINPEILKLDRVFRLGPDRMEHERESIIIINRLLDRARTYSARFDYGGLQEERVSLRVELKNVVLGYGGGRLIESG